MGIIAIDWSGAKRPVNKIWIAEAEGGSLCRLEALPSRDRALEQMVEQLTRGSRTIVGLDFAFSMPAWFLRSLGISTALELWNRAADEGERWLSDCASPFWGRPYKRKPTLENHYRKTESSITAVNGITPRSASRLGVQARSERGPYVGCRFYRKCAVPDLPYGRLIHLQEG